ncbi:MAG TPA: ABC transporter ATP-binding protein [Phycisphaerales bacterium]|nr:ABC transporter ATP-binding protein [Phycisphaerales bacterium]
MTDLQNNRPPGRSLVRAHDLRKSFNGKEILKGLSVEFAPHRTTVVLGPSGCGKSVMLKHLVGLLRPDSGEVHFDDVRIDTMPEKRMTPIRRQFGFLFQMGALFDSLNVRMNIEFPLVESGVTDPEERRQRVREVLSMVGLTDTEEMMPADLSGGQRKRIALARSIVLRPRVILYDEPTTGLDPIRSDVINELILKLQRELEATSIVVTHDLTSAFKVADHMLLMLDGKIVMQGPPSAFKNPENPEVARFMQGRASDEDLAAIRNTTGKIGVCS